MKKYKYLVVLGCSQSAGQGCGSPENRWSELLAKRLGLKPINLAVAGSGWYTVKATILSFINGNKDILNECFFILQKSMLERRLNYNDLPVCRTDIWEKWNIKYVSPHSVSCLGYYDWVKYGDTSRRPNGWVNGDTTSNSMWANEWDAPKKMNFFPEHRHYPNSRHLWKIGDQNEITPPYLHEQFQQLMLHWGYEMQSLHLFLKSLDVDHLMVDGYSPFLSYKLNFRNYYTKEDDFDFIKDFWSTKKLFHDEDEIMLYDFKNIEAGWLFDSIDIKYKIDDVILWMLYWVDITSESVCYDGGHAGPEGMKRIEECIYQNLIEKGWFEDISKKII